MFKVNEDLSIYLTRGDAASFTFYAIADSGNETNDENVDYGDEGTATTEAMYQFRAGDTVRFKAFEKKACDKVLLCKDFVVEEDTYSVDIRLDSNDTRIGEEISKPKDYWYEIELNPETFPKTIIGYDEDGPKVFRLYPEGGDTK